MSAPQEQVLEVVQVMKKLIKEVQLFLLLNFFGENDSFRNFFHRFAAVHRLALNEAKSGFFRETLLAHERFPSRAR